MRAARILHITTRAAWAEAQAAGSYEPSSLVEEGCIHFSEAHKVVGTARLYFAGVPDLLLLAVEREKAGADLRYENGYPHLYGALAVDAVVEALDFDGAALPVELRAVDRDNVTTLCRLRVHESQERLVAPAAVTIAESQYYGDSIVRGIYAAGAPAGVLWVALEHPEEAPFLVRLMIDRDFQRQGIGARAMALLEDELRAAGQTELELSFLPVDDGPRGFYAALGFTDTGRTIGHEVVYRKDL